MHAQATQQQPTATAFLGCRRGAVAVEFALVFPLLLALLFSVLETAAALFTRAMIEAAAEQAARRLRTGEIQAGADPRAAFRTTVCDESWGLVDCGRIVLDVRTFASFGEVSVPDLTYDEAGEPLNAVFQSPQANQVCVTRVSYRYSYLTPGLQMLVGAQGDHVVMEHTVAFKTEPFPEAEP